MRFLYLLRQRLLQRGQGSVCVTGVGLQRLDPVFQVPKLLVFVPQLLLQVLNLQARKRPGGWWWHKGKSRETEVTSVISKTIAAFKVGVIAKLGDYISLWRLIPATDVIFIVWNVLGIYKEAFFHFRKKCIRNCLTIKSLEKQSKEYDGI